MSNLNGCLPTLSATNRNYGITALHNYGFTVKLSPKKLKNQNLDHIKIETVPRGYTNPYSVAKLTRVPGGTLKNLVFIINQFLARRSTFGMGAGRFLPLDI